MTSPEHWKPGDPILAPVSEWVAVDPATISQPDMYRLLIGTIVPRPIALISTVSPAGVGNVAPFSFFNGVSSAPPCLSVSIARKPDGTKKDTLRNIEDTREFVVNTASEWLLGALVHCGSSYPYGTDEAQVVGFKTVPALRVKAPRVAEAAVQFECKLHTSVEIGAGGAGATTLVVGEIVHVHLPRAAYQKGRVDLKVLKPVARLGGAAYAGLGVEWTIPIPEAGSRLQR